jgi:DNA-binding MarR family transcriptional regulator
VDRNLSELATEPSLVEVLTVAQRQVARGLGTVLAEEGFGLDQWRVLRALADDAGHPMGELAETLMIPHPTLTRLVEGLVDESLVYRRQASEDRRRVSVHLALQGHARLTRLNRLVAAYEAAVRDTPEWSVLTRFVDGVTEE